MIDQSAIIPEGDLQGLTGREFDLFSKVNTISIMLAKHDRDEVVHLVEEEYGLERAAAIRWVQKAEDYMAMGLLNSAEDAKRMYHLRLTQIYDICMAHAIADEVRTTHKPIRMEVVVRTEDGEEVREKQMVESTVTEVKHGRFNTNAIQAAMKAAREAAHIMGGRPRDPKISIGALQINQGADGKISTAQETQDLANDQLAALAGFEMIDAEATPILPDPTQVDADSGGSGSGSSDSEPAVEDAEDQ